MELSLDRAGNEIRVSARGSRSEQTQARPLGAEQDAVAMLRFAASVQQAAERSKPLGPALLDEARAAQRALLAGEIEPLLSRLRAEAGGALLLRLIVHDPELQAVPWEALCKPGEALGFWGSSPDLLPVRSVTSSEPWQPREVRGAVRVLAVAPTGGGGLAILEGALAERIASGEVEWLDPIEGPAARAPRLFDRLRRDPVPHVLHFLGHGEIDKGVPMLRLADDDGKETWLPVELLAQQLKAGCRGVLRLVVLEACEGAKPSAFASAAEILARAGTDAVVAHLWPVMADVARTFSGQLYRALASGERGRGDIAMAMNEARRAILGAFEASAEALSPVLYLRGPDGMIFDFKGRKVAPPGPRPSVPTGSGAIDPVLARLLAEPFSLLVGDQGREERATLDGLADRLGKALAKAEDPVPPGLPLSALAQRFTFRRGADELGKEFQRASRAGEAVPPLLTALARFARGGVHTTLLRNPLLEETLAEHLPSQRIHVLQPGDAGPALLCREPGEDWKEPREAPTTLDLDRELLVLRLYRGVTTEQVFTPPLLTEDDYLFAPRELEAALPSHLSYEILRAIHTRPALLVGLSLLSWDHRVLLHRLFGHRPLPFGSVVLLDPESRERAFWERGTGLPGKSAVTVVEAHREDLCAALASLAGGEQ
jgi:hypothetical protein